MRGWWAEEALIWENAEWCRSLIRVVRFIKHTFRMVHRAFGLSFANYNHFPAHSDTAIIYRRKANYRHKANY